MSYGRGNIDFGVHFFKPLGEPLPATEPKPKKPKQGFHFMGYNQPLPEHTYTRNSIVDQLANSHTKPDAPAPPSAPTKFVVHLPVTNKYEHEHGPGKPPPSTSEIAASATTIAILTAGTAMTGLEHLADEIAWANELAESYRAAQAAADVEAALAADAEAAAKALEDWLKIGRGEPPVPEAPPEAPLDYVAEPVNMSDVPTSNMPVNNEGSDPWVKQMSQGLAEALDVSEANAMRLVTASGLTMGSIVATYAAAGTSTAALIAGGVAATVKTIKEKSAQLLADIKAEENRVKQAAEDERLVKLEEKEAKRAAEEAEKEAKRLAEAAAKQAADDRRGANNTLGETEPPLVQDPVKGIIDNVEQTVLHPTGEGQETGTKTGQTSGQTSGMTTGVSHNANNDLHRTGVQHYLNENSKGYYMNGP